MRVALVALAMLAGCASAEGQARQETERRRQREEHVRDAQAAQLAAHQRHHATASAPAAPANADTSDDPVEHYLARTPGLPEHVRRALRDRALIAGAAGMTREEVFLIVPPAAARYWGPETVVKMDGVPLTFATDRFDLDHGQRWQRLYFDRGGRQQLRAWLTWNWQLEIFD